MINILTSTETILCINVRAHESTSSDAAAEGKLSLKLKQHLSSESFTEQQAYLDSSATAAFVSLNKLDQQNRFRASVSLSALNNSDFNFSKGSSSSGFGYALALFDAWWRQALTKNGFFKYPEFATGEVLTSGEIRPIGNFSEKAESLCSFIKSNEEQFSTFYFCYPIENDQELTEQLRKKLATLGGILIPAKRLQQALGQLLGDKYDGDPLGRWEPYKGLNSFNYEDSFRFFGRTKEINRLFDDLQHNSGLLVVSGASGSGKSSLIKAGLIPKLQKENGLIHWEVETPGAVFNNGGVINFVAEQLDIAWHLSEQGLSRNLLAKTLSNSVSDTVELFNEYGIIPSSFCLLCIDQFEEFFNLSEFSLTEFSKSLTQIDRLVHQFEYLAFVLVIKNEYLGQLLDSNALKSPVISNIPSQLSSDDWFSIIHDQSAFSGISFEHKNGDTLDKLIIEEALNTAFALPMVEFLLEQLHLKALEKDPNSSTLTYSDFYILGGLAGSIAYRASEVIKTSNSSDRINHLFDVFVGLNSDQLPYTRHIDINKIQQIDEKLHRLIKDFIASNLIVSSGVVADKSLVKFAHDSLFNNWEQLSLWVKNNEKYLSWRQVIDGQFVRWSRDPSDRLLLKDADLLKEGTKFKKDSSLKDGQISTYLEKSNKTRNKKNISKFIIFIVLPAVAASLIYWIDNRITTKYYAELGEKWAVPYGIHELTMENIKRRNLSYRLDFKGGELIRLSAINSYGTLTRDPERQDHSLWEYSYAENGMLQEIKVYSNTIILENEINLKFIRNSARASFNKDLGQNFFQERFDEGSWNYSKIKPEYASDKIEGDFKTNTDISQYFYEFNENGLLEKLWFENPYGQKVPSSDGTYGNSYKYTDNNQIALISKISEEGSIYTYDGIVQTRKYYNDDGSVSEVQEKKDSTTNNEKFQYDNWGNVKSWKGVQDGKFFDVVFDLDDKGQMSRASSINEKGELTSLDFGVAFINYSYDQNGRLASESYFDSNSKPTVYDNTYHKIVYAYDENGNPVKWSYFNENNLPVLNQLGCAITTNKFQKDREVEETCFDPDGKLKMNVSGYSRAVGVRDSAGLLKRIAFFGDKSQPVVNASTNFHKILIAYDNNGNRIEETYFDIYGNPATKDGNSVKARYRYDGRGNVIEFYTLGVDDEIINHGNGIAILKQSFDALGRRIEEAFYNRNSAPVSLPDMYHKRLFKFSDSENFLESIIYYDANNVETFSLYTRTSDCEPLVNKNPNIRVVSSPARAQVFLNDKFVGLTPYEGYVTDPKIAIQLRSENFEPYMSEATIDIEEMTPINVILEKITEEDIEKLIQKAEAGDAKSQEMLGDAYSLGANLTQDYEAAKYWYVLSAASENFSAMHKIGMMYYEGLGVKMDMTLAYEWFNFAAQGGLAISQRYMGKRYEEGIETPYNRDEAIKWFRQGAQKGDMVSQYKMGMHFAAQREGMADEAYNWFQKSANQAYAPAIRMLGHSYKNGAGVERNCKKAFQQYKLAAELKDEIAYSSLGEAYQFGEGVEHDGVEALNWFEKSSNRFWNMGIVYSEGAKGVRVNYTKAAEMFEKSLNVEGAMASANLAELYLRGHGVKQSYEKAVELYKLDHEQSIGVATNWLEESGHI